MRGTIRQRRKPARFASTVSSLPAPALTYANASLAIACVAAASSSSKPSGTRGRLPLTPPR
jgi:hypothetical protein